MRTWFITGCSRGLGMALAREALARGDRVAATARSPEACAALAVEHPDRVLALTLDVLDEASVSAAVRDVEARWGIDVLVNNAGHGMYGAVEEVSDANARRIFDVNVFGLLSVTRTVLPGMRMRRAGHVVNISSIAGLIGGAGRGLYCATKFAVEGLSEAMAEELAPLGIRVTAVEPGPFRTGFSGESVLAGGTIPDYAETAGKHAEGQRARSGHQSGDPTKAAKVICDALAAKTPPGHLILGPQALKRFDAKITALTAEVDAWRTVGADTNF
ncbi:oxidoreductase [uncultured Jannaschia sp.]|uniref:oxidoreductase n=1 Tax=uncultured Jannaschia sp. TaxID=293347 RepID=UPI002613FA03|nr:oxidoreductase [uncultured Jannaschia sp.]